MLKFKKTLRTPDCPETKLAYSCTEDLAKEIDVVIASDEQSCIETARGLFPEHSPQFQPAGTSAGFCKATSSFLRDGAESVPRLFGIERSLSSF